MKISKLMATVIILFIIIFLICVFLFFDASFERDAYLYADFTRVNSVENGQVEKIYIKKGSYVKKGDTLFVLDCRYITKELNILKSQEKKIALELKDIVIKIKLAEKQRDLTKDSLIVEKRNFERYRILIKEGAVSAQQKDLAEKSLISSESQFVRACQNVDNLKIRQNDLLSDQKITQSKIDQKQYSLSRCSVKATTNGYISNFILEEGDFIKKGQELFSIVDTDKWYVVANVKESNIKYLSVGQIVTMTTSLTGIKKYKGKIVDIEKGITRPEYNNFSALYNIERNIDWVRLDYRFPVLIEVLSKDTKEFRLGGDVHVWF
ncbi:HlyD family secretion protein [Francisella tularensis]|uniref:HlyD family secretion protein n=3 Tax=Francisella tularensis TaxID=263 RepID=Q5NEI0_FRATT|nr:efflux RND transporter periplasmic adaptor subunit [Francisella tularensis]AAV29685.1 NT02FT0506 [synthetic construct]ABO47605.1 HlyD family secretion protein [Francisella tularensis subsp. tularensis WY96-3418]ADA79304.1 HlyD family secretion protein [Francisella tularensis subsp. tularensis NE061598]AFB79649.1 Putative membrane protein [Francisella tularensis subsp. tularensis TIGB03]AFB81193.1 Putative membrane protein [Francisella tularensis subsp. tularensis TI0902]